MAAKSIAAMGRSYTERRIELIDTSHELSLSFMLFTGAKMMPVISEVRVMFSQRVAYLSCVSVGLLAVAACTTPRVRSDADSHVNISAYHTYGWEQSSDDVGPDGTAFNNPLN